MTLRGWRAVLLLTVFLKLLGFGIVLPLLPYAGRDLGAGGFAIGALFAAYSLTQFVLAPVWGAIADRFGRRPVLLASIAWGSAAYVLFALATSYETLLLSRVLAGLSAAVIGVSQAYLADRTPAEDRAGALGLLGAAFGMGFVVGPALGAVLSRWGFAVPGFVAAGLCAANFLVALRWLPESLPRERRRPVRGRSAAGAPRWRWSGARPVLAILFLSTAAFSVLYPVFPLFVDQRFGFGPLEAGILFSVVGLVAAAIQGGALGRLARRVGERRLLASGVALMGIGLALLPLATSVGGLAAALAPVAFGFAVTTPLAQTFLSRLAPEEEQGGSLGAGHAAASLARACGPLAGGWLFQHLGAPAPFWAATCLLLVAGVGVARLPRPTARGGVPVADARHGGGEPTAHRPERSAIPFDSRPSTVPAAPEAPPPVLPDTPSRARSLERAESG
ncbi:MAG: MFS transporter [Gemmatimonadota bacterium]